MEHRVLVNDEFLSHQIDASHPAHIRALAAACDGALMFDPVHRAFFHPFTDNLLHVCQTKGEFWPHCQHCGGVLHFRRSLLCCITYCEQHALSTPEAAATLRGQYPLLKSPERPRILDCDCISGVSAVVMFIIVATLLLAYPDRSVLLIGVSLAGLALLIFSCAHDTAPRQRILTCPACGGGDTMMV